MTKEELLRDKGILKGNGFIWDSYIPSAHIYNLLEVMDEYAKQQVIDMISWSVKHNHYISSNGTWHAPDGEEIAESTSELYGLFIEQQNKP